MEPYRTDKLLGPGFAEVGLTVRPVSSSFELEALEAEVGLLIAIRPRASLDRVKLGQRPIVVD
jgi:hypothetical protein